MQQKLDYEFNMTAQVCDKIALNNGVSLYNNTDFQRPARLDFKFDIGRQCEAKIQESLRLNPRRSDPCTPTPREELMRFDPPMLRDTTFLRPIKPLDFPKVEPIGPPMLRDRRFPEPKKPFEFPKVEPMRIEMPKMESPKILGL